MTPGGDYGATFIAELDRRIEDAPDAEERTRLERFRAAAGEIGKGVITSVLADMTWRAESDRVLSKPLSTRPARDERARAAIPLGV